MNPFKKLTCVILFTAAFVSCTKENITSPAPQTGSQSQIQTENAAATLHVGDKHGGGIIFYLDATGKHGLIAAPSDQSTGIKWYRNAYIATGAKGAAIGTGESNTTKIINKQGNSGSYAAKLCADLVLNGFDDWFLPSKAELNQLYKQRGKVPGLEATNYWSSTEYDANTVWDQEFGGGYKFADYKNFTLHVRAVRSF